MDESHGAIWFFGDLSDPWVVSIADALPAVARRVAYRLLGRAAKPACRRRFSASADRRASATARASDAERLQGMARTDGSPSISCADSCASALTFAMKSSSGIRDWSIWCFRKRPPPMCSPACGPPARRAARPRAATGKQSCSSAGGKLERRIVVAPSPRPVPPPGIASNRPTTRSSVPECQSGTSREPPPSKSLLTVWDVPVLEEWTERLERHALQLGRSSP